MLILNPTIDSEPDVAVATITHRVPDDMLTEIFLHYVERDVFAPQPTWVDVNNAWVLARVCRRWRDVALSSPRLWCCILGWLDKINKLARFKRILIITLRRAKCVPLSIRLEGPHIHRALDQLLAVGPQWKEVALVQPTEVLLRGLAKEGLIFSSLKKLQVTSSGQFLAKGLFHVDLRQSMPSLEHLIWDVDSGLYPWELQLPWSQLRTCVIRGVRSTDFLYILSLLAAGTHVSAVNVRDVDAVATRTEIASLSIDSATFRRPILLHLVAPALRKLVVNHRNDGEAESHWKQIISLLNNSGCPVTHLRIQSSMGPTLKTQQLLNIIKFPRGQDLVRLDVYYTTDLPALLRTLANKDEWVPNLRTLALVGVGEDVMAILADRNPVVRILEFSEWEWDFPEEPVVGGLDVVVFRRPYFV
ncbi:hypothetical protein FB45DRAFT_1085621 [Roridomyces roridus]|uniref:F-box domain-containing protein n=1 Tax=Roridomyces roridus TaxID=1738132 RepID=A0AAD7AXV2_9AGAR|nr:hypothetical protein FB45DRAFT_1085621 [Roridomyces roridus]